MFYIHQNTCISPQQSFSPIDLSELHIPVDNSYSAIEPAYKDLPPGVLRRMGKAVRIGVGSGISLTQKNTLPDGIIIGTANGGMEDCIRFLDQIVQYEEGKLTPGNFVQSTPNAIASMLSMLTRNKGYNITHVHRGLAFENAILDAAMRLREHPSHSYLLGSVDEISAYNYNIELLGGWYKEKDFSEKNIYAGDSPGSMAGEGAAAFMVNAEREGSVAELRALSTLHSENEEAVKDQMASFLERNLALDERIDLFVSGENGDSRLKKYYTTCESLLENDITIARFKHMSGEYPTASSFALWLSVNILQTQNIPAHAIKNKGKDDRYKNVLIYNTYKGKQHSLMLCSITN